MQDILGMSYLELEDFFKSIDEPRYRAEQFAQWIYGKKFRDFSDITNFKKELKDKLEENAFIYSLKLRSLQTSKDGTKKYLFALEDGELIETVLLRQKKENEGTRNTLCISTQVGCPMNCSFCATGQAGFERDLKTSEIIAQIADVERIEKLKINNVVFMGMGEPFLNYDNVVRAIKIINEKNFFNIGIRKITVSTCGLVPEINRFAEEELDVVLAVSLHSADDTKRSSIMPVNRRYNLEELKKAIAHYISKINRRVTLEYAMIRGFNDKPEDLRKLISFCQGLKVHVNLIPINETEEEYKKSEKAEYFASELKKKNIESTVRQERGADIDAACGQLKGKGRKH
ncbi:MAG: 23S rRNA (adenine(2503)-C(2))-methyltransferase RlmN [Eubacteriales bacterium]|nr:23S rRNA (adenine(2503)-C(2))-methyltransferase RlmN [Eubacteriales bacterium]